MTENEIECLEALVAINDHPRFPMKWARPLDLGGSNGSHHSGTLNRLAQKGLVNFRFREGVEPPEWENGQRFCASRGATTYRITPAGRAALSALATEGKDNE